MGIPVSYDGPVAAIDVPSLGVEGHVRGKIEEYEAEIAKALVKLPHFSRAETPDARKKREKAAKDQAEQDEAAEKAADEARKKVAAAQAKRDGGTA